MSRRAKRSTAKTLPHQAKVLEGAGMSVEGTSFAAPIILHGDRSQMIQFMAFTHPDDDHRRTSEMLGQARISRKFYGGGLPTGETANREQNANHSVFISFNYDDLMEHALRRSPRQEVVGQLPT